MKFNTFGFSAAACLAGVLTLGGCAGRIGAPGASTDAQQSALPKSPTGYYAMYMATNNIVLYGKMNTLEGRFIRLTDVHYIRSNVDPQKKEVTNQIIQRGAEWHKPEETLVAADQILFVEPVAEDSRVMALIREIRVQQATP
jgi:hypothetical protein